MGQGIPKKYRDTVRLFALQMAGLKDSVDECLSGMDLESLYTLLMALENTIEAEKSGTFYHTAIVISPAVRREIRVRLERDEMNAEARFHKQRRMFYVADSGEIILARKGDTRCHADWLSAEYGITETRLRGYIDQTGIYFYSTDTWDVREGDLAKISRDLGRIILFLDLKSDLPVWAGAIPGVRGVRWKGRTLVGKAEDFV